MPDYTEIFKNGMFHWIRTAYLLARKSKAGIKEWQKQMETGLTVGYDAAGAKRNSGPEGFLKYVVERDKALGLPVGGKIIDKNTFQYWIIDFFLPLKEACVTAEEYDNNISTGGYLAAKIKYFCPDFKAKLVKSTFMENEKTEWILTRKS